MTIRILRADEHSKWDAWVRAHPQGSLWQSGAWETYQRALGRETRVYAALEGEDIRAAALVVIDRTTGGLATWNMPRGPIWIEGREVDSGKWIVDSDRRNSLKELLEFVVEEAAKERCLTLYFSPLISLSSPGGSLSTFHYPLCIRASARHEQPAATRILDLTQEDDTLLAQMKPKGRYNIRVAQKKGVVVEESRDIEAFHRLLQTTGERDAFGILPLRNYRLFLEKLPGAFLLLAYEAVSDQRLAVSEELKAARYPLAASRSPIAGLLGVTWGTNGIYYYGASDYEHRALMAPYVLQWEAMQLCKQRGCISYDLLGIEPNHSVIQKNSNSVIHPWAGVSRFKAQFGGSVIEYPAEQQIVLRPVLEKLLGWKRRVVG